MKRIFTLASNNFILFLFFLTSFFSIFFFRKLLLIQSDPKNALFLGFSLSRIILASFFIGTFLLSSASFVYYLKNPSGRVRLLRFLEKDRYFSIGFITFFLSLLINLIPPYQFGDYQDYFIRLQPLIQYILITSGLLIIPRVLIQFSIRSSNRKPDSGNNGQIKRITVFILIFFIVFFTIMFFSKIGTVPDAMMWHSNGIPLLATQMIFSVAFSFLFNWSMGYITKRDSSFSNTAFKNKFSRIMIFLFLWFIAAIVWISTPTPKSDFAPSPSPPNNEVYPLGDAMLYDAGAETALIGQGFTNYQWTNAPLVSFFSYILHLLTGKNFSLFYFIQVAVFAVIPACIYLLGEKLSNPKAGMAIALFVMFHERNSFIGSLQLSTSHAKLIMSEIPTALLTILMTYFLVRGMTSEDDSATKKFFLIATGILAVSTLVRHNTWLFLPMLFVLILLKYFRRIKHFFKISLLVLFLFALTISPWAIRSYTKEGQFYFSFLWTGAHIAANRYTYQIPAPTTELQSSVTPSPVNSDLSQDISASPVQKNDSSNILFERINFIANHFFHNIWTTIAILPHSTQLNDLNHSISIEESLYNSTTEPSQPSTGIFIFSLFNIVVAALGLWQASKMHGLAGIVPLIIYLTNIASLAISRTSGGRYIVSVQWLFLLYFALGLVYLTELIVSFFSNRDVDLASQKISHGRKDQFFAPSAISIFIFFFLIVLSIPLVERITPQRYPSLSKREIIDKIFKLPNIEKIGYSKNQLYEFSNSDASIIAYGRALYPRYLIGDGGIYMYYRTESNLQRLVYYLIGPQKKIPKILFNGLSAVYSPINMPVTNFPNESDVIVIGCPNKNKYIDSIITIVLNPDDTYSMYSRDPKVELNCSLSIS